MATHTAGNLVYYPPMKLAVMIGVAALLWTAAAKPLAVGPLGPSDFADTEVSTDLPFAAGEEVLRELRVSLELAATPSNGVELVFGRDANADGALDLEECDFALGWNCGCWFARDVRSGDEMREERESGRRSLVWRLAAGADGAPKSLAATDGNAALFAAAAKRPPSAWFGSDWNLVRISARGLSAADEAVRVHVGRIGLEVRVR